MPRKMQKVNLARLQKRLENVLEKESKELWEVCKQQGLTRDQSTSLCNYLKLCKELRKYEEEKIGDLTDEELAKLAKVK